jgi:hypothetical protein
MASSSETSRKWGREEDDDDESRHCWLVKDGTALALEEPEEVPPTPPEVAVVWTSLGPLPQWVPGPTARWAPGTTRLVPHGT